MIVRWLHWVWCWIAVVFHAIARYLRAMPVSQPRFRPLAGTETNALIVMDAGIATEANLQWLQEQNCRYLVVSRKRHVEWDEELSQIVRTQGTNEVRIYSKQSDDGEEVELYCRSSSRAALVAAIDSLFQQRFEAQIQALADGLTKKRDTPGYTTRYCNV